MLKSFKLDMAGRIYRFKVLVQLFLVSELSISSGQKTFTEVKDALENNIRSAFEFAYSLRPVNNISEVLTVYLDLNIAAINDFNEQNGYIEISGYLNMEWIRTEGNTEADNFEELVRQDFIWRPPIIMVNAIKKAEQIGWDTNVDVRLNFNTLRCSWRPWIIARAACTPDVKYYPFDKQACSFKFAAWGYNATELLITTNSTQIAFEFYEENGEWEVGETSASSYIENSVSVVEYKVKLTRRPTYYVINLIAPIILLAVLNVFVFILPPDSGERIGYSITCFLSYVVLLNTVMAFLPTSAAPLAYLSYYTFIMMCFSAGMSLATIVTLRIHYKPKDGKVSPSVKAFLNCICCKWLNTTTDAYTHGRVPGSNRIMKSQTAIELETAPTETETNVYTLTAWDGDELDTEVNQLSLPGTGSSSSDLIGSDRSGSTPSEGGDDHTWEKIASYLDIFFFLGFLGGQVFYSVAYLVPIVINA